MSPSSTPTQMHGIDRLFRVSGGSCRRLGVAGRRVRFVVRTGFNDSCAEHLRIPIEFLEKLARRA